MTEERLEEILQFIDRKGYASPGTVTNLVAEIRRLRAMGLTLLYEWRLAHLEAYPRSVDETDEDYDRRRKEWES